MGNLSSKSGGRLGATAQLSRRKSAPEGYLSRPGPWEGLLTTAPIIGIAAQAHCVPVRIVAANHASAAQRYLAGNFAGNI